MACAVWLRETPIGKLTLMTKDGVLRALEFGDRVAELTRKAAPEVSAKPDPKIDRAVRAYFDGEVAALDEVEVELEGTEFQRSVWAALRRIPAGETWTYARLAREVGRPKAVRAVGTANGANPVAVVVPCHRVIATGGKLGGYGGGLDKKAWLLRHEKAQLV